MFRRPLNVELFADFVEVSDLFLYDVTKLKLPTLYVSIRR